LCRLRLTPLREFTMMRLMNQLTDKADWETKVRMDRILRCHDNHDVQIYF
jgi:hypothetical protein